MIRFDVFNTAYIYDVRATNALHDHASFILKNISVNHNA